MWQLVDAVTNRVTYRNLWDQWEACKTSFHKDGNIVDEQTRTTDVPELRPYRLEQVL